MIRVGCGAWLCHADDDNRRDVSLDLDHFSDQLTSWVAAFGEVGSGLTEFRYPVKATTAGTFAIPASGAEAMYDRNVRGQSAGGVFTVTE